MATKKRKTTKKKPVKRVVLIPEKKRFAQGKELLYFGSAVVAGLILIGILKYFGVT